MALISGAQYVPGQADILISLASLSFLIWNCHVTGDVWPSIKDKFRIDAVFQCIPGDLSAPEHISALEVISKYIWLPIHSLIQKQVFGSIQCLAWREWGTLGEFKGLLTYALNESV